MMKVLEELKPISQYYQYQSLFKGLIAKISSFARKKMFMLLMQMAKPTDKTTVLDVGVTCDQRQDSNFFEKMYPYPNKIVAVFIEDAYFLKQNCPSLKLVKADGTKLPFHDRSFDLVVSFATIEHTGSREEQSFFIRELCRVSRSCCIATPNRWFPLEFHTLMPFIHWFPPLWFRAILKFLRKDFFARQDNLNLLTEKDMLAMFPMGRKVVTSHIKLCGLTSNLMLYIKD